MSTYQYRLFKAGKLADERKFHATDDGAARLIASAKCSASEIAYDFAELWKGAQPVEWKPPAAKSSSATTEGRQRNIIDTEVALANSAWARNNLGIPDKKEARPRKGGARK